MKNYVLLTKKQHDSLFDMVKGEGFNVDKINDKFRISSEESVKWMFRRVEERDKEGTPRIEFWRYLCNVKDLPDTSTMVRQCWILL